MNAHFRVVFAVHLSNGQGLGPHNPAYDGYGGAVQIGYALDRAVSARDDLRSPSAQAPPSTSAGRSSVTPGGSLDGELGRAASARQRTSSVEYPLGESQTLRIA